MNVQLLETYLGNAEARGIGHSAVPGLIGLVDRERGVPTLGVSGPQAPDIARAMLRADLGPAAAILIDALGPGAIVDSEGRPQVLIKSADLLHSVFIASRQCSYAQGLRLAAELVEAADRDQALPAEPEAVKPRHVSFMDSPAAVHVPAQSRAAIEVLSGPLLEAAERILPLLPKMCFMIAGERVIVAAAERSEITARTRAMWMRADRALGLLEELRPGMLRGVGLGRLRRLIAEVEEEVRHERTVN